MILATLIIAAVFCIAVITVLVLAVRAELKRDKQNPTVDRWRSF